jgi:hypothetical protein
MGAVCFVLLVLFLPLKPVSGSFKDKVRKIDWWGVLASIAGIVLTVVSMLDNSKQWQYSNQI